MKDRLDELFYNVGRSLYDDEHVLIKEKDFDWLIEMIEEQAATIETLSMAHDDMARELSLFKEKDKQQLIKSNIKLNKRVQELEVHKEIYYKTLEKIADEKHGWNPLSIEARIAIEKVGNLEGEE